MSKEATKTKAYVCEKLGAPLVEKEVSLPALGPEDVEVKIAACGVCGSDIAVTSRFETTSFPVIAGHEGIGQITQIGDAVKTHKVGDRVGIGCYRDSCRTCRYCETGHDNLCALPEKGIFAKGQVGCFGEIVRLKAEHAFKIPENIKTVDAAPLMCGGITVYAPFKNHNISADSKVGVIGIGGLGHLAIQFGAKFGCQVYAISTSPDKEKFARELGATNFVNSSDEAQWKKTQGTLDYLFVTASSDKDMDYDKYIGLLAPLGKIILIGLLGEIKFKAGQVLFGERAVVGSMVGGKRLHREMLEFASFHNIRPVIEKFKFSEVNEVFKKVNDNKVRFRAVLIRDESLL